jgi:hypothetical protein
LLQPSAVPPVPPGVRRPSGSPVRRREHWSLTTLREKLVKIGARIVRHGRYLVFQLAEVAVPRTVFAAILRRIERLRGPPMAAA